MIFILLKLFGKKLDEEKGLAILRANTDGIVLLEPTGVKILLDLMPWLRHFPNKTNEELVDIAKDIKAIVDEQIYQRKV